MLNKTASFVFTLSLSLASLGQAETQTPFYDMPREIAIIASQALHDARVQALAQAKDDTEDLIDLISADKRRIGPGDGSMANIEIATQAGVISVMLLSEIGLSEAYEEAVEGGETSYLHAWLILQAIDLRLRAVTADHEALTLLEQLTALMPVATRPTKMDPDPEAAEAISQALVGVLERVTSAELYLGRDLASATQVVRTLFQNACAAPEGPLRTQFGDIAALYFEDVLEAPFSVMVPNHLSTIDDALDLGSDQLDTQRCMSIQSAFDRIIETLFPGGAT